MIYLGYSIYLFAALFLVAIVGRKLHRDGGIWINELFDGHPLANRLNNLLLLGYCLVNLGQAFFTMTNWDFSRPPILEALSKTGVNMLILSYIHIQNIVVIYSITHLNLFKKWKF